MVKFYSKFSNPSKKNKFSKLFSLISASFFIIFFISLAFPVKAAATNYYVSCSGGSDGNNGTSTGTPLASLQRFSEIGSNQINLSAGDNLYLARGCNFTGYNLEIDWNGTSENPITIGAYGSGDQPKVWLDDEDDNASLNIEGSYITIEDLYITVDQETLPHTYVACPQMAHGLYYGIKIDPPANNITIQNNTITQFSRGINVTVNSSNPSVTPHHLNILHNNISFNTAAADGLIPQETMNGGKAIDIKGNDNVIAYNYMEGNSTPCTDSAGLYESNAIEVYAAKRNFIHHNVSIGQRVFSEMGGITNNLDFNTEDTVFAYNLVTYTEGPSARFIVIHGKNQTHGPTLDTKIYNNTYYAPNDADSQAISCSGCDTDVLTLRNNIIWARNKNLFVGPSGTTINESNNIFWNGVAGANIQNWTKDASSLITDPGFVDATNGNFRLESDSPAIGAGSNTESLSYDFNDEDLDGISLPQGDTVDIGAYENGVSAPSFNGTNYVLDTFTRTTSGWGDAETGGTWTTGATGSGSSNSVSGTEGIATMGSCGGTTTQRVDTLDVLNTDTIYKLKTNKFASGEDQNFFVINRKQSAANWEYRHRIQFNGGDIKLTAGKLLGTSSFVSISSNTTIDRETFAAGTFYWVRVQTYGTSPTTIRMKIWEDGTSEPSGWDLTATDSEATLQNSGAAGVRGFIPSGCTTAPLTATYDDLTIRSMSSPTISLTAQYQSNCSTILAVGGAANGTAACVGATVNDPDNPDTITLQAEVQPINTAFTNTANYTSSPITASGEEVNPTILIPDLTAGISYHWQARAVDSLGNASAWVPYGNNTETTTDFSAQTIPTIQFSPTSSSGAESITSVSLPVTLSESTSQDVSVNYAVTGGSATGDGNDFTLANGVATVTAGQTSTTIPLTIINDTIDEDDETIVVTLSNPNNGTLGSSVIYTYTIQDNDNAGTSINPSSSINVTEGGATANYTIKLNTKPTSDVTVTLSADSQITTSVPSLTFTDSNWFSSQSITVTAVDDAVAEGSGTHNGIITHIVTSADSKYDGITMPTKTAKVTDNDSAGVSITESSGATAVEEGGDTDTYTIALTTQPTNDVTISVSPDSQVSVDDNSLLFTDSNWSTPQTITVTAVNDDVYESSQTGTLNHSASSSDNNYNSISIPSVSAEISDNDTVGVVITESSDSTAVTEGGATDTYTVELSSEPTNDVTITLTHDSEVSVNDTTLDFTASDWDTPQTVTVTAVDDVIDEDEEVSSILHSASSSDSNYNSISVQSVSATVTDNDTASVTVTQSGGTTAVAEGGATDTFTIELATQPTHSVTIEMSTSQVTAVGPDEPGEGELGGGVIFTTSNWDTPQTVTVTAVDDGVAQGTRNSPISFNIASPDSKYSSLSVSDVTVNITDNDTAGVTITESGGSTAVAEGGATDTYTIVLDSEPADTVAIAVAAGGGLQTSATSLNFTTENWDTPQTVTVTAVNDSNYVGDRNVNITHTAISNDDIYDGFTIDTISVGLTEDDSPGVTITETSSSTTVTEGGATDTYSIVLDNAPAADVTVNIAGTNGQVSLSDTSVTFTTENWDTPQDITVTAINDDIAEGPHQATLTHSSTSSDNAFNELTIGSVTVAITDNDTSGISITQSGGSTAVAEETETSDSYTVVLTSEPTASVTINLSGADDVDIDTTTLTFTTENWDTPQTVTVTAIDDSVARGLYSNVITHTASSSDSNYNNITISSVTVTVTDNDSSGITVTQSGGNTAISESGTTDTFTVVLDTQPSADVVITMASSQAALVKQGTASNSLTFTNSDWNVAQTVEVTAINDSVAEGTHIRSASFSVSSSDVSYDDFSISDLTFTITDNDTAGVTVTQSGGSTTLVEGGTSDTYTVVLNTQPSNNVTISASPGSGLVVTPTNLTFTTANWSTPQEFSASATNNTLTDGDRNINITHSSVSDDNFYNSISISMVTAAVSDDEVPELNISESGNATVISENGGTDSYTITLATQPSDNVVITVTKNSSDLTLSASEFTFTADNWDTPQTMTVTGVNDSEDQGSRVATLIHTAASDDANFDSLIGPNVSVTITDDDGSSSDSDDDDDDQDSDDDDEEDDSDTNETNSTTTPNIVAIANAPVRTLARILTSSPSAQPTEDQESQGSSVVVPIEANIDLDEDGDLDTFDLEIIKQNWGKSLVGRTNGDINDDGRVDLSDVSIFARNWP